MLHPTETILHWKTFWLMTPPPGGSANPTLWLLGGAKNIWSLQSPITINSDECSQSILAFPQCRSDPLRFGIFVSTIVLTMALGPPFAGRRESISWHCHRLDMVCNTLTYRHPLIRQGFDSCVFPTKRLPLLLRLTGSFLPTVLDSTLFIGHKAHVNPLGGVRHFILPSHIMSYHVILNITPWC